MSPAGGERPIGLGCMRLSTEPERDEARGIETIVAALAAGATLLDTADVYGHGEDDLHHNERLVARALAAWGGARKSVRVVTKGGLRRAKAKARDWAADGRATHLRAACEASLEALGEIDLYLLHAIDPRTAIETSVRALAGLREAGRVRGIGVCNVTLAELDRALAVADIEVVQVAMSPFHGDALRGGVVERCAERGILVLAHSPLGGPKKKKALAGDQTLRDIATRHGATPAAVAVAWLRDLSEVIVPIPGARTPEAARAVVRVGEIALDAAERSVLDARFPAGAVVRSPRATRAPRQRASGAGADADVVVLMGIQGAGKSTRARELEAQGYVRLNRDAKGGRLRDLIPQLQAALTSGAWRVVLDNTYATRASRNEVIEAAWKHGAPVRCVFLDTPLPVAQANVARRMIDTCGRLLEPAELERAAKADPALVPPRALFRYREALEIPSVEEGFASVEVVPFVPRPRADRATVATIAALEALTKDGAALDETSLAEISPRAAFAWAPNTDATLLAAARERLEVVTCEHPAGPPKCWCRPPLPGLVVDLLERHHLDPTRSTLVGTHPSHRTIADAVGMRFRLASGDK